MPNIDNINSSNSQLENFLIIFDEKEKKGLFPELGKNKTTVEGSIRSIQISEV